MKVVLGFSGGLDTCACLRLLQEKYDAEVITVIVDVGQRPELFKVAEERAKKLGAVKHVYIDAKEEFVREYVFRSVKANGCYEGYPLSISLARYPTASWLARIALQEGAEAVAHGCTGKGNDQFRFDLTLSAQAPGLRIIAPVRELNLTREVEVEYLGKCGLSFPSAPYSVDENLWGRSIEGRELEDPFRSPPEEAFQLTQNPAKAPREATLVTLGFEEGVPVTLNGERMGGVKLIGELNRLAGTYGIGRIDVMEDRILGLKVREVYEAPAATVILEAHKALEALVLTREELVVKERIDHKWSEMVYGGRWFDPLREDLEAFIEATQRRVTGEVKVELLPGKAQVVGRSSPHSLYEKEIVSFHLQGFDQRMAASVTKFHGLDGRVRGMKG
ncbi:MAG: argininosuccinate synthase [Candidatus Hadarchaeales archaeon]